MIPKVDSYYNTLDSILLTRLGNDYLFRFTALPSSDPEFALQIELNEQQYFLKVISFDKNIWNSQSLANINIDDCIIDLKTQTAENILFLSRLFVENRMDSVSFGSTTDTNLFLFEVNNNGMITCGQVWGPTPGCSLDNMCRLCTYLKDWCCCCPVKTDQKFFEFIENKSMYLIDE